MPDIQILPFLLKRIVTRPKNRQFLAFQGSRNSMSRPLKVGASNFYASVWKRYIRAFRKESMATKYFEDFTVGSSDTFGNYHLTKDEIIEYAKKWDPQPFHIDEKQANQSIFRGLTAAGSHIFAISILLIMQRDIKVKVVAMLGIESLKFKHPARPDDQLSVTHECINKRESENRKDCGVVQNKITLKNQKNEVVLTYVDNMLIAKKH